MRLSWVVGLAGALAVCGCTADPEETVTDCPKPYLLPDASSVARYNGRGTDLSDLMVSARMVDVQGACTGKVGTKHEGAHAHAVMVVNRGPAFDGSAVDLPYSVGVIRNGQILDEHAYVAHVVFPPNVNAVQVTGQEVKFALPTSKTVAGPSYHLYFWFQLTPQELQVNRQKS